MFDNFIKSQFIKRFGEHVSIDVVKTLEGEVVALKAQVEELLFVNSESNDIFKKNIADTKEYYNVKLKDMQEKYDNKIALLEDEKAELETKCKAKDVKTKKIKKTDK